MAGLDIVIALERAADRDAIEGLERRAFGPGRFARSAYRLREGSAPDPSLSFVARVSTLVVGSIRMTPIAVGGAPALLLGPLTVDPAFRSRGIGRALVARAMEGARAGGHRLVLLVGDEAYYGPLGFRRAEPGRLRLPGPADPARVLMAELAPGAAAAAGGPVTQPL